MTVQFSHLQKRFVEVEFIELGNNFSCSAVKLGTIICVLKQATESSFPTANKLAFKLFQQLLHSQHTNSD